MPRAIRVLALLAMTMLAAAPAVAQESRQATGVKVGEVTPNTAIVWMRLTKNATRNNEGVVRRGRPAKPLPADISVDSLEGACPGMAGQVRLRYGTAQDLSDSRETPWTDVTAKTDFTHQFELKDLKPNTTYYYSAETAGPGGAPRHKPLKGHFQTAPPKDVYGNVTFTVVTGQAYKDLDDPRGFNIYPAMGKLNPQFIVPTGDTVYYDSEDPRATEPRTARYHWDRMYGLPRHIAFHLKAAGYWEKDDHDCLSDDCWPTLHPKFMLPMTFEKGLALFREETPMGEKTYRTFRWGKGLQIWLTEGRDFRSPNTMPDGPDKTIWGATQKKWLKDTLLASDADWKVLVSPTPIVGPDRSNKRDNHANEAFQHEGDEMRAWFQANLPDNFFICCGDRHWQYHSIDPKTQVQEFSCGPASDQHAGGAPKDEGMLRKFFRQKGGFLSVHARKEGGQSVLSFRFHDVNGKVVNEHRVSKPAK